MKSKEYNFQTQNIQKQVICMLVEAKYNGKKFLKFLYLISILFLIQGGIKQEIATPKCLFVRMK